MNVQVAKLTMQETDRLQALETVVGNGKEAFVKVGCALAEIRDDRLYRESFDTFEEYCVTRWQFKRNYANKLIVAAGISKDLGTIVPNEATARELAKANPEHRQAVVESVAAREPVTAKAVREEVKKLKPKPELKQQQEVEEKPNHIETGESEIEMAISMAANSFFNLVVRYKAKEIGLKWWQKIQTRLEGI